jgi:hypothetical protein
MCTLEIALSAAFIPDFISDFLLEYPVAGR